MMDLQEALAYYLHNFCVFCHCLQFQEGSHNYYPNNGMYKYEKMFIQLISPRDVLLSEKPIIILWSNITGALTQKKTILFHQKVRRKI